jgi:hypothetical protein
MRLLYLTLLTLVLCVSSLEARAKEPSLCSEIKPFRTKINITYETVPPVYDLSLTTEQLNRDSKEVTEQWLRRNSMEVLWTSDDLQTAGLASGAWALAGNHRLRSKKVDWMGAYHCAFFEEVNIAVFYRTIIYIPKDYPQGTCKFNAVHRHELRHHDTNQAMVDKYVMKLDEDIRKMIPYMEGEYVGSDKIQERFDDMKEGMSDAIKVYLYEAMVEETKHLNAEIDTPQEYENTGKLFHYCDLKEAYDKKYGDEK